MPLRVYLIILAVIVVLGGVVYGLDAIPWFRVTDVAVTGNTLVSASDVRQALTALTAKKPVLALLGGDHVFLWLRSGEVALNIPAVRSASVQSHPFERRIDVVVRERTFAGIRCTEAECAAFDEEGIVYARAPEAVGQLFLVVRGEEELSSKEVARFSEVRNTLAARGVAVSEMRMRAAELNEWEVVLTDGKTLYFDRSFIPDDFGAIMEALIAREDFAKMHSVDFRVPNKIYFR